MAKDIVAPILGRGFLGKAMGSAIENEKPTSTIHDKVRKQLQAEWERVQKELAALTPRSIRGEPAHSFIID